VKNLVKLGQTVMTSGVSALIDQNPMVSLLVGKCLARHAGGDWGDVCAEDAQANQDALRHGSRLLSSYKIGESKVWIITEADRSVTTVLFPSEY